MNILMEALFFYGALLAIPLYLLFKSFTSPSSQTRWTARLCLSVLWAFFLLITLMSGGRLRHKQSEAKSALSAIAMLQKQYFAEFQTYADSSRKLGFGVKSNSGKRYYTYSYSGVSANGYTVTATSLAPGISRCGGGEGDDVWIINEKLQLKAAKNAGDDQQTCYYHRSFLLMIFLLIFWIIYDLFICKPKPEISEHQGEK